MSLPRLGNGENVAYIYSRNGTTKIGDALVCSSVKWGRGLCKVSEAELVLTPSNCSPITNDLGTWGHSVVIYRDGDRVWEGPIQRLEHGSDGLLVKAADVLAWTGRRRVRAARALTSSPVRTEMAWTIGAAFAPDDPNVLAYVATPGAAGASISRDVAVDGKYHLDDLTELVKSGGRFTVVGRRIVLWDAATTIGRTLTLVPEKHLLADVTVVEDGDNLATDVFALDDAGNSAEVGGYEATFYGLVDTTVSLSDEQTTGALTIAAQAVYDQSFPSAVALDVPAGAAISCDAPFPIAQLVPGTLVPVETTTATGKTVSATMVLSNVAVEQTGSTEKVAITLTPLTGALT